MINMQIFDGYFNRKRAIFLLLLIFILGEIFIYLYRGISNGGKYRFKGLADIHKNV